MVGGSAPRSGCHYGCVYCKQDKEALVERYLHHGCDVAVVSEVKGKHREHCLCFLNCRWFKPGQVDNCQIAQMLYENAVKNSMVTPVYECRKYEEK